MKSRMFRVTMPSTYHYKDVAAKYNFSQQRLELIDVEKDLSVPPFNYRIPLINKKHEIPAYVYDCYLESGLCENKTELKEEVAAWYKRFLEFNAEEAQIRQKEHLMELFFGATPFAGTIRAGQSKVFMEEMLREMGWIPEEEQDMMTEFRLPGPFPHYAIVTEVNPETLQPLKTVKEGETGEDKPAVDVKSDIYERLDEMAFLDLKRVAKKLDVSQGGKREDIIQRIMSTTDPESAIDNA